MSELILPDLNYDCLGCGRSCTSFEVEVTADEHLPLRTSPVSEELAKAGYHPLRLASSGRIFLGKEDDGRCTFLTKATRCSLHQSLGYESKPLSCRDFPFHARPTPDGVFIGLSFFCSAVSRGQGRHVESRRAELTARFAQSDSDPDEIWPLWGDVAIDWSTYKRLENYLTASLARPSGLVVACARLAQSIRHGDSSRLYEDGPLHPQLGSAADDLLQGLLTLIETAGESPPEVEQVMKALGQKKSYFSRVLKSTIHVDRLDQQIPEWYEGQSDRYLRHLLFRKTLLEPPDLLSRACLLALVTHALRFLTCASAQVRQRDPSPEDLYEAVAILEGRLMLHTKGMESYFSRISKVFLDHS